MRVICRFHVLSRCDCLHSGIKPFGDGMSQEKMLQVTPNNVRFLSEAFTPLTSQEGTMLRAATAGLTFPSNPKVAKRNHRVFIGILLPSDSDCELLQVSQEAKDFIKRCLARVDQRPDVLSL